MNYQKTSPSQMLRVPTALIPAVRELSRLYREGHTTALLQALQDLIIEFDSNFDSNLATTSKAVQNVEAKLDNIESKLSNKLDVISSQLEKLSQNGLSNASRANSRGNYRHRSNSY